MMVLSGMSNMEQMQDNLSYMKNFKPLNEKELKAVYEVQNIFNHMDLIRCTGCRYCVEGCPKQIAIPDIFTVMPDRFIRTEMQNGNTGMFIPRWDIVHPIVLSVVNAKQSVPSTFRFVSF